jgi:predicted MFS family arabinose efflux permease
MRGRGPLANSYPAAVALVVSALVPFLMLTAAMFPLLPLMSKSLGLSKPVLDVTIGLSDAGYAFGTVLAVQFAVHLPARRMLVGYVTAFVVAAVLAAWAPDGPVFVAAFIAEGLCTSLMLIAAVPPLVTGWPTAKMPGTGLIMNLCIFGAVALGPTIGGLLAASGSWRPLFWGSPGWGRWRCCSPCSPTRTRPRKTVAPHGTSWPWRWAASAARPRSSALRSCSTAARLPARWPRCWLAWR